MAFVKKHPFLCVWAAGLCACAIGGVSLWKTALGSLLYGLAAALTRPYRSIFWIGYILQSIFHRPKAAWELYEIAYRRGGRAGVPMMAYAMLLLENFQYEEGLNVLQEAKDRKDLMPALEKIRRQNLAIAYEKTGDLTKAIGILEQMGQDYQYHRSDYYTLLAYYYIEAGELEKAERVNALAQEEGTAGGGMYDNLGLIAYKRGKREEAEDMFRKALEAEETMVSPRYYLAQIAEDRGDRETAAQYLRDLSGRTITGLNILSPRMVEEKCRLYCGLGPDEKGDTHEV